MRHDSLKSPIKIIPLLLAAYLLIITSAERSSIGLAAGNSEDSLKRQLFLPMTIHEAESSSNAQASWGAPVAVSPRDGSIWVVNPDAGSVTMVDGVSLVKQVEIATGGEPWSLAFAPDGGRLYVVDRAGGALVVVDTAVQRVVTTLALGPEAGAIVVSANGERAYVAVTAANRIAVVDTEKMAIVARIAVAPLPYGLALSSEEENHGGQLYVTHLLAFPRPGMNETTDDGRTGRITVIDTKSLTVSQEITLLPDSHGFPNLLNAIAIGGKWAWVPQVRAAPALPNGLTTTVFAAVSTIDRLTGAEESRARLSLNDVELFGSPVNNPVAAIPSPDGKRLYVVLAGSNVVEIIDIGDPYRPRLVKFLPAGQNPRGMALSADGHLGYVMSYLSRSLTVLDLVDAKWSAEVAVTHETLDAALLRGKLLFNTATDPRVARGSWFSCASCHPDGGSDGVTWFFPDGPRQTPALWNSGRTLPWHWSAALDEPQDVEVTIEVIQQGVGLAPGLDAPQLGPPLKGHSSDLDALAIFLQEGLRLPHLPRLVGDRANTSQDEQGRQIFVAAGCAACHGGAQWTVSALPGAPGTLDTDGNGMVDSVLRDVGTLASADLRGATGFDVPSLLGVGLTAPYLHDGSMPTLEALLQSGHPDPQGTSRRLTDEETAALVAFLESIGAETPPVLDRIR